MLSSIEICQTTGNEAAKVKLIFSRRNKLNPYFALIPASGYLGREDKTTEDIDPEGWMHSGDMATIDSNGFVAITGRQKLSDFFFVL